MRKYRVWVEDASGRIQRRTIGLERLYEAWIRGEHREKVRDRWVRVWRRKPEGHWIEITHQFGWQDGGDYGGVQVTLFRMVEPGDEEKALKDTKGEARDKISDEEYGRVWHKRSAWQRADGPGEERVESFDLKAKDKGESKHKGRGKGARKRNRK